MKRLLIGLLALALLAAPVVAQSNVNSGIYEASPSTLSEGQRTPLLTDANRRLIIGGTVPGTAAASLGKAEDAAHTSGDVGVSTLCVANETAADLAGTDADYTPCATTLTGAVQIASGATRANGADAQSNSGAFLRLPDAAGNVGFLATMGMVFNSGGWDRPFTCPNTAVINVAAAATTQLVALSGSTVIRVCSFAITGDTAATTATFVYGTGTNCGTGTTSITGAMRMVDEGNIVMSSGNGSLFRGLAANALCLTAATGAVTGFVTYAQY